ncbi:hypothetical protein ACQY0O_001696 [Thecaphora frezii]
MNSSAASPTRGSTSNASAAAQPTGPDTTCKPASAGSGNQSISGDAAATATASAAPAARTGRNSTGTGKTMVAPPEVEYQWLFSKSDLQLTPSVLEAGIDSAQERQLRNKGINLIYRVGDYMRLPQHVLSTACIFFHRFYMRKPLQYGPARLGYSHYEIAAACIFLSCKVEETHRKLPFIIDATMASLDKSPSGLQKWAERTYRADPNSKEYGRWRDIILVSEEVLLEALAFDVIIDHPHEILVKATYRLGVDKSVARLAWTILNDCMRDPTCVMFEAPVLAAGAFKKACAAMEVDPNTFRASRPPPPPTEAEADAAKSARPEGASLDWKAVFDVDEDEAEEASEAIEEDVYAFHGGQATPAVAAPAGTEARE